MKKTCETCINSGIINQKTGLYICPDCDTGFSNWEGLFTPEAKDDKPFFEQFRECDKNGNYSNGLCVKQNITCYSAICLKPQPGAKTALYSDKWLQSILDEHSKEEIALLYQQLGLKKVELSNKLSQFKKAINEAFPTNWLDPKLTGKNAIIGDSPFGCPDIEALLYVQGK